MYPLLTVALYIQVKIIYLFINENIRLSLIDIDLLYISRRHTPPLFWIVIFCDSLYVDAMSPSYFINWCVGGGGWFASHDHVKVLFTSNNAISVLPVM
jgi:hypothetical protein